MQNMEVELKFALAPDAAAALHNHALLKAAAATDARALASTYFDTPHHDLRKARVACRIREESGRRVQTVKAACADAVSRQEWECEINDAVPDLSRPPLPRALRKTIAGAPLTPMFRVEVERWTWTLTHRGSLIEAALDRGWIVADARNAPVCEFELELKEGDARDLFDLARILCADLPLDLDLRSKAQRGWALKDGDERPADKPTIAIDADASFTDGFATLVRGCLETLASQAHAFRAAQTDEPLHQTRIALRRLLAVLRVFRRDAQDDWRDELRSELKGLSRALGAARDLDVAGQRLGLEAVLKARRDKSYARVLDALASARFRRLIVDLADWLSQGEWRSRKPRKQARGAFADVTMLEFHRWERRIRKAAQGYHDLDAEERHELRIRAKSLMHCCELTADLASRGARKDFAAYLKALKALQSALGDLNDARFGGALLDDLRSDAARDPLRRATRRNERDAEKYEDRARKAVKKFLTAPRPFA